MRRVSVTFFVFLLFVFPLYLAAKVYLTPNAAEKYLFVWAGDQARKHPDFLAVLNFDSKSKEYGKLITRVQLPGPGSKWNEPHHVGLSQDGNILGCGGLLSVLKGQKEIFFFDVSNPTAPVVMFDIANPTKPKVLKVLDLGPNSGPHYIALTKDEKRLVITDYFLNEDAVGKVHAEGDHKIHVAKVHNQNFVLDTNFEVDFNRVFKEGPARPHGVAMK